MRYRLALVAVLLVAGVTVAMALSAPQQPVPASETAQAATPGPTAASGYTEPDFEAGAQGYSPSERAGREIWYKATAGNERFHTYVFQQRVGVLIDWFRVLRSDQRGDRFRAWGAINDPGCCTPGSPNCPAKSLEETYGFDWCPGDEELLKFVGKTGYRDPSCDFKDAPLDPQDQHAKNGDQRQSPCDLKFGTSTGALGIRKFPNPKFNRDAWLKLNGAAATWQGYSRRLDDKGSDGEAQVSRLLDGSVEPPYLIGTSCGSCHIAFDPLNPPADPANPKWENIKALIGNQYTRFSEIMVSGMQSNSLEWQMFAHARPGTSDTSAIASDQVNNPGTINALINIAQRPTFANESVRKWRKTDSCTGAGNEGECWCEPGRSNKCWRWSEAKETVHHVLKGGEDSIGVLEAIQRVYFNIGSCSEQCWVNHFSDLRQIDPQQRGFGQTPFDIGQCRRDCPNFRAIEDRLPNILAFFLSKEAHATDLQAARENTLRKADPQAKYGHRDLVADLEKEFGAGAVARGEKLFAENCARCHSSQADAIAGKQSGLDFRKVSDTTGQREDWLGNDRGTKVTEVGTERCRALHSNHMEGHVWQQYGSETLRARERDANLKEASDGGRSYYRNISLLNLWAHAPFMHNNAVGPELCGKPQNKANDFYGQRPRYVGPNNKLLPPEQQPACFEVDPSVDGRLRLYKMSMDELLNPDKRGRRVTVLNEPVTLRVGPRLWDGDEARQVLGLELVIPLEVDGRQLTAGRVGNFQHKPFIVDLVRSKTAPQELEADLTKRYGAEDAKRLAADFKTIAEEVKKNPRSFASAIARRPYLASEFYTSCREDLENGGHRFGEGLPPEDKKALTAFLATL